MPRAILQLCLLPIVFLPAAYIAADGRDAAQRYQEAFSLTTTLPRDAEKFAETAEADEVARLEDALELLRENVGAETVDWGVDWELEGFARLSPEAGQFRHLTRLGIAYHERKLQAGEHDGFVEDMSALLRASRHFAEGQPLIHYLTSLHMESLVMIAIAQNSANLPAEDREKLQRVWREEPPGPTLAEAFAVDRQAAKGHLWNVFAGTVDPNGDDSSGDAIGAAGWADDLRISSIVSIAGEIWGVGFEDAVTEESFRLRPGERHGELELVWVDAKMGRALLRHGDETAIVQLEARSLHPIDLDAGWERLVATVSETARLGEAEEEAKELLEGFLNEADGDPLAAFEAFLAFYDSETAKMLPLLNTSYADLPDPEEATEDLSFMARMLAPAIIRVRNAEFGKQASEELFMAGLDQLRNTDAPLPVSEVTGDPIRARRTDDALIMESTFLRGDEPLTVEFPLPQQ